MTTNGTCSNLVDFKSLDATTQNLIRCAVEARTKSYSPYSSFPVGASALCEDGTLYTGCNVENKSYGLTICAERTTLVKAVSEGRLKFKAMAVIAHQENKFTPPCGACREFISEFGTNIDMYIAKPTLGQILKTTSGELLPYHFEINTDYSFK